MNDLFDQGETGLARNEDPETSHQAAAEVDASNIMEQIYNAMIPYGDMGCIADEVGDALPHIEVQTYTPRFNQMVERGMIEVTGEKRRGHHNNKLQMVRRVLPPPFKQKRKVVPSIPDGPGVRVKYFQTQEGLRDFAKTLGDWDLPQGMNIRITVEVVR